MAPRSHSPIGKLGLAATAKPEFYNNVLEQVKRAVELAQSQNLRINPEIHFVWIQGQTDAGLNQYKDLLKELLARLEADVQIASGLGTQMKFNAFISQLRGVSNRNRAIDQIAVATDLPNAHFGAQESWISNAFALGGVGGTHLQKIGYRVLGEQIGNSIFQYMMDRQVAVAAITSVNVAGKVLAVNFAGLRGTLVEDNSVHQSHGLEVPPHFGFYMYTTSGSVSSNKIVASRILSANQVELTLTNNVSGPVYLYLGRNQTRVVSTSSASLFSGTTLRDEIKDPFYGHLLAPPTFLGTEIPRFASLQRVLLSNTQSTYVGNPGLIKTP